MTKLLIVDDMAIFREPIAASLRREGFEAVCASNGNEALDLLCSDRPDLVLLDIAMPVMDGLSCLKAIRKRPQLRDIPVIMLTATSERKTLNEAVQVGVQGYLLKSQFSLEDLLGRVRAVVGSGGDVAPGPAPSAPPASSSAAGTEKTPPPKDPPAPTPLTKAETLERIRREATLRAVPTVLNHVLSLTGSARTSFDEVGTAVRKDHALALRVMRVANSSFFGSGTGVQTLAEAAQRIGMSGVRNTIASILTIEHFSSSSVGGLTPQRFWEHSLATAVLADGIARMIGMEQREHVFLAGLMHDVGRLMLSTLFPDHYKWLVRSGAKRNVDLVEIEREAFGLGHDEVTKDLLTQWQTPEDIHDAAWAHELPADRIQNTLRDPESALVVALANRLVHAAVLGDSANSMLLTFSEYAKALKLKGPSIRTLVDEAIEKTRETEIFYASRSGEDLRGPLAKELGGRIEDTVDMRVFAIGSPGDPLSLFCEQLGWLGSRRPRHAILFAPSPRGLLTRVTELLKFERGIGTRLAVLVASPVGVEPPPMPPEFVAGRRWRHVQLPTRYTVLIEALEALRNQPVS